MRKDGLKRVYRYFSAASGCLFLLLPLIGLSPAAVWALQPNEVLLVANRAVPESVELARYYQQKRHIPAENLLIVNLPDREDCSRVEYRQQLELPLRRYLPEARGAVRCLLLFYGVPLRVAPPELEHAAWQALQELRFQKKKIDWRLENRPPGEQLATLQAEADRLQKEIAAFSRAEQGAAVDSELTLLLNDAYVLERWQPNPYFVAYRNAEEPLPFSRDQVLLVARLDASKPEIVRRMIDDSLQAERQGLTGRAYFDARWPLPEGQQLQGCALYDASLHKAAEGVAALSRLPVTLDQQEALLQPGDAPEAALYCGWYRLGNYVDAFDWQPGAVAYHIASSECTTLKKTGSQVWCKRLLEDGASATIGPVAEPYVQAFPLPELFFSLLLDGYYTLVESYFLSTPFLSWQMILIGDPLYRPFRNRLR